MNFIREANKIYLNDLNGHEVAKVEFESRVIGEIVVTHTFVDHTLRGQGIAKKLMDELSLYAKDQKLKIVGECSYAIKYLAEFND